MFYLVFDFETTGTRDGTPHNYPTQFACELLNSKGKEIDKFDAFIKGATILSPWVLKNCPNITIEKCNEGIDIHTLLQKMYQILHNNLPELSLCTLVAHNMDFDWAVLTAAVKLADLESTKEFQDLSSLPRLCTMKDRLRRYEKWPKLKELAESFEIVFEDAIAHDAVYDAHICGQCLPHILRAYPNKRRKLYTFHQVTL